VTTFRSLVPVAWFTTAPQCGQKRAP
jgi:hypothetical protein